MESLFWGLKTHDAFSTLWPLLAGFAFVCIVSQSDFTGLLVTWLFRLVLGNEDSFAPAGPGVRPTALVVIPSLLRNREDYDAIAMTVESCATNGYPAELVIIASVDGRDEKPALHDELCEWVHSRRYPRNVRVYVSGNGRRLGKMMAVEAGVQLMKKLVERGTHGTFPTVYFSIDGDGSLGPMALERLVARLTLPHRFSGNPRRVVAGNAAIRPELYWQGWSLSSLRNYFTVEGQIYRQVARELLFSNVARHNRKLKPHTGIPGALYCTWTDVLLEAPRFMGFLKTIRLRQWLGWWVGFGPPRFSETSASPLPEALTGPSDDTCISFLASMAHWKNGKLSFDAPRSPLHALGRLLKAYFLERSPDYEPRAHVFTFTPSTIKSLWVQRVRWNASRFECGYRFKNALAFHWEVGVAVVWHLLGTISQIFCVTAYYLLAPYYVFGARGPLVYLLGYGLQVFTYTLFTVMALAMESERRQFWPALFALPFAPLYCISINFLACITGLTKDFLLFGNTTNFAPEWTFKKGRTARVALLFRVRRFLSLCLRSLVVGDVPLGGFWLGWTDTPWTPSGYDGWTTGKRAAIVPPLSMWFRRKPTDP